MSSPPILLTINSSGSFGYDGFWAVAEDFSNLNCLVGFLGISRHSRERSSTLPAACTPYLATSSLLLFYSRIGHECTAHTHPNDDPVVINSLRQHDAWQSALPPQCLPSLTLHLLLPLFDNQYMLQHLPRLQLPQYRVEHSYQAQRSRWAGTE